MDSLGFQYTLDLVSNKLPHYKDYNTILTIGSGSIEIFMKMTGMIESLIGVGSGLSEVVSDEVTIDAAMFLQFTDLFFATAEKHGKYKYFLVWAQDVATIYERVSGLEKPRQMLNIGVVVPTQFAAPSATE